MRTLILSICALAYLSGVKAFAQKNFSTKALKIYASPIYTINSAGIRYGPQFIKHNADRDQLNVPEEYNYRPATLKVPDSWNIGAGLEYELYLKNSWYIGTNADFRTAHTSYEYRYNSLALFGEYEPQTQYDIFNQLQKLNTYNFGLYAGKQFKWNKKATRCYEVRLGYGMAFNANKISVNKDIEYSALLNVIDNTYYYAPFVYENGKNLNRSGVMWPENMRLSLYFGSEGQKPLVKGTRIYGFCGIQGDFNFLANRSMSYVSLYAFEGLPDNFRYKSQQVNFHSSKTINISLKLGLMLK